MHLDGDNTGNDGDDSFRKVRVLSYVGEVKILGRGVPIFAPGRGVVKYSPGKGIKLFLQGEGRVGGKYKKCFKKLKETKETTKKVAVLAA